MMDEGGWWVMGDCGGCWWKAVDDDGGGCEWRIVDNGG